MNELIWVGILNVIVFTSAAAVSKIMTKSLIKVSHAFGFLDIPVGRKKHDKPMPYLGGAALFISFWSVIMAALIAAYLMNDRYHHLDIIKRILMGSVSMIPKIEGIFTGSLIVFVIGILDDKFDLKPSRKFAGQILAAIILMGMGLSINIFAGLGILGYCITFIWILLLVNAFNFIDSLDGHCTGIGLIATIAFFWITQIINQPMVGFFLVAFAGALIGFFPSNFKPAKIFLGDNGSLFMGYILAAITMLCTYQVPKATYATVFIPVLIFAIPIYDTLSVVAIRLMRGVAPWRGDRNHFAHRLVRIGMNEKVAVTFSYFISVTIGLLAILTTQVTMFGAILIGLIVVCILGSIAFLEFYTSHRIRIIEKIAKKKRRRREDIQLEEEAL